MTDYEVERWLSTRGCTLWGEFYDITTAVGRRDAARWLVSQIELFSDWKLSQS